MRVEELNKINQFKRWWNFLPTILFVKQISKRLTEVYSELNKGQNDEAQKEIEDQYLEKCRSEIESLTAADMVVFINLDSKIRIKSIVDKMKRIIERDNPKNKKQLLKMLDKIKFSDNDNLRIAINNIKELTGQKLETSNDFIEFKDGLKLRVDKLNRTIQEKNNKNEGKSLSSTREYVLSYLSYLKIDMDSDKIEKMKVYKFILYRNIADKKAMEEKEAMDEMQQNNKIA
jgi:hypothetical protein